MSTVLQHMAVMFVSAARCRCCIIDNLKQTFLPNILHVLLIVCVHLCLHVLKILCVLGWEVAGDHVQSGAGRSDNDYLILTLTVPGFK